MCFRDQGNIKGKWLKLTCKDWAVAGWFLNFACVSRTEWVGFLKWLEVLRQWMVLIPVILILISPIWDINPIYNTAVKQLEPITAH